MKEVFSRIDTKIIKGVAILLMLTHHLWAFPDRIVGGGLKSIIGSTIIIEFIGAFGKICVSLFFFLGGYGIYMQSKKRNFTIFSSIKKLFLAYWKVFLIFIPIAFLFFRNQLEYCADPSIYARYNNFDIKTVLENFFGMSSSLNGEWWFLGSYLVAIVSFPLWKKIFSKLDIYQSMMLIAVVNILMTYVAPALGTNEALGSPANGFLYRTFLCQPGELFSCFFMGMLFAKNNWLIKIKAKLKKSFKINFLTSIFAVIAIVFLRHQTTGASLDIVWVPFLIIFLLEVINRIPGLPRILESFGKHSTTMWLTHTFCCYYFYPLAKITTLSGFALPSLLTLIAMSYLLAVGFDYAWFGVSKIGQRILKKITPGICKGFNRDLQ